MSATHTPRLRVDIADLADGGSLTSVAIAAGEALVAIGIPTVQTEGKPRLADGVGNTLDCGGGLGILDISLDAELCERRGFSGLSGESLVLAAADRPAIIFVGCGLDGAVSPDVLRRAAATFARGAGRSGCAAFVLSGALVEQMEGAVSAVCAAQVVTEGAILATYRFVAHKSEDSVSCISSFVVVATGMDGEDVAEGVRRGRAIADAVVFARDMVNEPPSKLTPGLLAAAATSYLEGRQGMSLEVWDEQRIVDEHLGGLLGVARGSAEPPRLLWASYEPSDPVMVGGKIPHVVLVGKGITFDSGGLSLKTGEGMMAMKTDMGGAAAVLGAIGVCGELGANVRVTAIAPVTENMPGGRAIKPGDVLTIRDGQTIEVLNTDAEGRLVLADGLTLASELQPDAIIDLATLTGACVVALGRTIAGLFGNDQSLIDEVRTAADRAGEPVWPLPLVDDYRSHIESEVADMKNVGKAGQAGAISAALLLARFAKGTPWVHLDIAGPARSDEDRGIVTKGGTGFGVRTLLELIETFGAQSRG